ncbi:MAG TPA: RHS repeat-associated core domain-containing protein, partial [Ohtaekwangia sp.]|nr:RHS repeat-associated core domain-containing protein [Ohtaekwangia sp.]
EQVGEGAEITLTELPIYGSDRLGMYIKPVTVPYEVAEPLQAGESRVSGNVSKSMYENISYLLNPGVTLTLGAGFEFKSSNVSGTQFTVRASTTAGVTAPPNGLYTRELDNRRYELKDHLGNIRSVISDIKLSVVTGGVPGSYEASVTSINNYYPFGMDQPGRMWNASGKYRYGFNGKEKDDNGEWGSTAYDYGFRIYNPSIGRFLSVDPLTKSYAELTPYQFASNKPINSIDLDGLEARSSTTGEFVDGHWTMGSDNHISLANEAEVRMKAEAAMKNKPFIPNYGTLRNNDITSTPEYKMFEINAEHVLPIDVSKRLINGEEVSSLELGMEAIALFPPFKVVGKGSRFLKNALKLTDNAFHSASGLTFKFGSKHGNRLSHVMAHTSDNLTKDFHGVFDLGEDLVKTLDDAWDMVKKGGANVKDIGDGSFIIDMGRKVGYEGGKKGSGDVLKKIKIVVEKGTENVITAYPVN